MTSLRFRLGNACRAAVSELRWPLRLRRPLFSPKRECRRIVARQPRLVAGNGGEVSDWETHEPVLVELLKLKPAARVLELGTGFGSTPVVLGLSGSSVSLETSEAWYRRFARFDSVDHRVSLWRDVSEFAWECPYLDEEWDIAFVDNAPAHSRQSNLEKLSAHTRFVVCHDTQEVFRPSPSDYRWDFSAFRFVWTYTQFGTYTTVVSNIGDIPLDHLPGTRTVPSSRYSGGK